MMQMGECNGVRVGAITKKTNLSRPAVSHHLGILKDAGLVKMRREGTKKVVCIFSLLQMSRKPLTVLWLTTENSACNKLHCPCR